MYTNTVTLTISDYNEIFIDSINSENGAISDYLFSKYLFYKNLNPNFASYIKKELDESCEKVKIEINNNFADEDQIDISEIVFILNHNTLSLEIQKQTQLASLNKNYITSLKLLVDGYSDFIKKIDNKSNVLAKLNWDGNKIQLIYLLHKLKKLGLISNTYESLSEFLINNINQFDGDNKQTIMDDLKNGTFPKRGVNLDDLIKELKESK